MYFSVRLASLLSPEYFSLFLNFKISWDTNTKMFSNSAKIQHHMCHAEVRYRSLSNWIKAFLPYAWHLAWHGLLDNTVLLLAHIEARWYPNGFVHCHLFTTECTSIYPTISAVYQSMTISDFVLFNQRLLCLLIYFEVHIGSKIYHMNLFIYHGDIAAHSAVVLRGEAHFIVIYRWMCEFKRKICNW